MASLGENWRSSFLPLLYWYSYFSFLFLVYFLFFVFLHYVFFVYFLFLFSFPFLDILCSSTGYLCWARGGSGRFLGQLCDFDGVDGQRRCSTVGVDVLGVPLSGSVNRGASIHHVQTCHDDVHQYHRLHLRHLPLCHFPRKCNHAVALYICTLSIYLSLSLSLSRALTAH